MTVSFPVAHSVASLLRDMDLDPKEYPGTLEMLERMFRMHVETGRTSQSAYDFAQGLRNLVSYLRFQMDTAHDYAPPFFGEGRKLADDMACALMGGVDLLLAARRKAWRTPGAHEACRIVAEAGNTGTARDLYRARMETRFFVMMDVYYDLCAEVAQIADDPIPYRGKPLAAISAVGRAEKLKFPHCQLTLDIMHAEKSFREAWSQAQPAPRPQLRVLNPG